MISVQFKSENVANTLAMVKAFFENALKSEQNDLEHKCILLGEAKQLRIHLPCLFRVTFKGLI